MYRYNTIMHVHGFNEISINGNRNGNGNYLLTEMESKDGIYLEKKLEIGMDISLQEWN